MRPKRREQCVTDVIGQRAEQLIALLEAQFRHPELGFEERRTAGLVTGESRPLKLGYLEGLALTTASIVCRATHTTSRSALG